VNAEITGEILHIDPGAVTSQCHVTGIGKSRTVKMNTQVGDESLAPTVACAGEAHPATAAARESCMRGTSGGPVKRKGGALRDTRKSALPRFFHALLMLD
jgi:hypothetical protein